MNLDELGTGPSSGFDPLADPFANSVPLPTTATSTAYYAPTSVQVPVSQAPSKSMPTSMIIAIVVSSVGGIFLLACVLIGFVMIRRTIGINSDEHNMKMVALAFLNYESSYKHFPAPASKNSEKKPVYSWAVSIVPFTDDSPRYTSINYSTALSWDARVMKCCKDQAPPFFGLLAAQPKLTNAMCS